MRKHKGLQSAVLAEKPAVESFIIVDFPQEKEVISSAEYTLRLGASPDAQNVEVSIDGGDWRACRQAVGYWWFDWSGYSKVAHKLSARVMTQDGRTIYGDPRAFSVRLPKPAGAPTASSKTGKTRKKLSRMLADANLSIG